MSAQAIYLRTKAGRVHRGAIVADRVMASEACNLDDAPGTEEVLTSLENIEATAFCGRCFPHADDDGDQAVTEVSL